MDRDGKETVRRILRRLASFSSPRWRGSAADWCPLAQQGAEQRARLWEEREKQTTMWGEREKIRWGVFFLFAKTSLGNIEHMAGERRGGAGPAAAPPAVPLGPMCAARCAAALPRRGRAGTARGHRRPGDSLLSSRQAECFHTAGAPSPAPRKGRAALRDGEAAMSRGSGRGLSPRPDGSSGSGAKRQPWRSPVRPGPLRCPRARRAVLRAR